MVIEGRPFPYEQVRITWAGESFPEEAQKLGRPHTVWIESAGVVFQRKDEVGREWAALIPWRRIDAFSIEVPPDKTVISASVLEEVNRA